MQNQGSLLSMLAHVCMYYKECCCKQLIAKYINFWLSVANLTAGRSKIKVTSTATENILGMGTYDSLAGIRSPPLVMLALQTREPVRRRRPLRNSRHLYCTVMAAPQSALLPECVQQTVDW
ncbi:uncharacterized protein TrAtP1_006551 [Trichoderma atroviride]|uniref:uncharacterized protein n=1 Tax=Hypocrea atroviridis TaxID=63577 RepID=UPI00331D1007|nr:hypothetical protein TrAtP1_006551 [Trichoderma atroviride]